MAKDWTDTTTRKLFKQLRALVSEIEDRLMDAEDRDDDDDRDHTDPGYRAPTHPMYRARKAEPPPPSPEEIARRTEATLQRRLSRPHLPKPDPAYLAAFERTRPREPAPQPTDTEAPIYATAPGPSEPAE